MLAKLQKTSILYTYFHYEDIALKILKDFVSVLDMNSKQQNTVIDNFRKGKHKMLVATNLLEQGTDIPACNLVIRLDYVPSDFGHVQIKGRYIALFNSHFVKIRASLPKSWDVMASWFILHWTCILWRDPLRSKAC